MRTIIPLGTIPDIPITPIDSSPQFIGFSPIILTLDGNPVYGDLEVVESHHFFPVAEIKVNGEPIAIRVISKIEDKQGTIRIVAETIHLPK